MRKRDKSKYRLILILTFLISFFIFPDKAFPLIVQQSLKSLSQKADRIIIGKVKAINSYFDKTSGLIKSRIKIKVKENVKKKVPSEIEIEVPGGKVGNLALCVSDTPHFTPKQKVLLFLKKKKEKWRIYGWSQGKFTIEKDFVVETGERFSELKRKIKNYLNSTTQPEHAKDLSELNSYPIITQIEPPQGSAGTHSTVTILGNNFGTSQGNGYVTFFQRSNFNIRAPISSWSNNKVTATIPTGASSGEVILYNNLGLASNPYLFQVTFSYAGYKWPKDKIPVKYYVNEAGTSDAPNWLTAIKRAFETWNQVPSSSIEFTFLGKTRYQAGPLDGRNILSWDEKGNYPLTPEAIAVTIIWYNPRTKLIVESETIFNGQKAWSDSGEAGKYDIQSVATHEIGHWLALADLYGLLDARKTMYGLGSTGDTNPRTLEPEDMAGAVYIYPQQKDNTPPTTSISVTPSSPNGQNGWYTVKPTITLRSSEPGVTYYQWNSTNSNSWQVYKAPLRVNSGTHRLYYFSVDLSGNRESYKNKIFKIDTEPPIGFDLYKPPDKEQLLNSTLTFKWQNSADWTSGLAKYQLFIGGRLKIDSIPPGSTSVTLTTPLSQGWYSWFVKAIDYAGNERYSTTNFNFKIVEVPGQTTQPPTGTPTDTSPTPPNLNMPDVPKNSWFYFYFRELVLSQIIVGYPNGKFRPMDYTSRAEFVKMIVTAAFPDESVKRMQFKDADEHWANFFIEKAKNQGIVNGYPDGQFRPDQAITRAEAVKIVVLCLNLAEENRQLSFSDLSPTQWAYHYIARAFSARLIDGYSDKTFRPAQPMTRAEAAKIVFSMLTQLPK
jgi:hypothetical protein